MYTRIMYVHEVLERTDYKINTSEQLPTTAGQRTHANCISATHTRWTALSPANKHAVANISLTNSLYVAPCIRHVNHLPLCAYDVQLAYLLTSQQGGDWLLVT